MKSSAPWWTSKPPVGVRLDRTQALCPDLGLFLFREGAGLATHNDAARLGTGHFTGSVQWAAGPGGDPAGAAVAGVRFTAAGSNSWIESETGAALNGSKQLTVVARFLAPALGTTRAIVSRWNHAVESQFILMESQTDATALQVYLATALGDNGSGFNAASPTGVLTAGQWTHVAFTYDGAKATAAAGVKLYVNGIAQALTFSGTMPASLTSPVTAKPRIGNLDGSLNTWSWVGYFSEVMLFSRALSAGEVAAVAAAPYSMFLPLRRLGTYPAVVAAGAHFRRGFGPRTGSRVAQGAG